MTHALLTLSYCRCDPCGSAHFLSSHCRCEIPDNVDFLLQPHTLSSYCRCSSSDTVHFFLKLHNLLFTLHNCPLVMQNFSLCMADVTFLIMQTFSSQHALSTTDVPFLLSLFFFPCFSTTDVPFLCCTLFLMLQKPSSRTADATLLVLNTLYWYYKCDIPYNEDILFRPHTLSSCYICNPPDTVHLFLTLHSLLLVLQMRPSWYCTFSLLVLQM